MIGMRHIREAMDANNLVRRQQLFESSLNAPGWWFGTFFIFPYMGNNDPNWRTHIFQRGRHTTNQNALCFWKSRQVLCQQRPYSGFQLRGFLAPGVWQLTCGVRLGSEESKIEKMGLNTHVLKHLWTTTAWWFGTFFSPTLGMMIQSG